MTSPTNYNTVILDIEGTITPITFVKEVLFPYVTNGLDTFLDKEWGTADLDHYIQLLRDQAEKDVTTGLEGATLIPTKSSSDDIKAAVKQNIKWQMAADRKIGALKAFQGYMWKTGYENGELVGMVYDDVIPALNKWQSEGKKIYIYSSGSVPAQKLLIGYTKQGDLSKYFSGYFDTTVGLKVEKQSYLNIAKEIGIDTTNTILFVTDNINEIHAADQAGLQVVIADRPGNAPLVSSSHSPLPHLYPISRLVMFSSSGLDLPTHADSAEMGYGKTLVFDAATTSTVGFLKHSLSIILDSQDSKQIFYFLLLNLTYMFVQLAYGVWTNSLGLISDAIHMFFDCLALGIGLFASVMSKWPSNSKYSYGYNRIETISAFFNGIFLVLISISIVMEAIQRLLDPPEMNTQRLLLVSFVGLVVNLVGIFAFNHGHAHGHGGHDHGHGHSHGHGHDHGHSANMEGVFLHIMADTLGSVGVIVSTLLIKWFGWTGFDPIASLFIAILIVLSVIPLIKHSASVLMLELDDGVVSQVEGTLEEVKALDQVADIAMPRFWPNEASSLVGSLHVYAKDSIASTQELRRTVTELLMSHIDGLKEVCVQVEFQSSARQNRLHQGHQTKGFFHTPPPPFNPLQQQQQQQQPMSSPYGMASSAINTPVNYRSSAAPLPTFATDTNNASIMTSVNNSNINNLNSMAPPGLISHPVSNLASPVPGSRQTPPPNMVPGVLSTAMMKQTKKE